ncbi:GNAT family N-acetyltransferase [Anaerolineales bacterium HSG6]|nr:GNAT family N-acetyltransferase [Anaerolineales bacterium HSG6]MDM8531032.1 GNAT family N-acetyltransferase [Anaerolineales bacterium HSG25]
MDPTIRTKLDNHIIAAQALFYRAMENGLFEILPDWVRGKSGVQIPSFNIFMPLNENGLDDEVFADTAAFFNSQRVVYAIELIHDHLPHGPDYLNKRRYQPLPPQPAMLMSELPTNLKQNAKVRIERVKTVPAHTAFYTTLHAVFDYNIDDVVQLFPVRHLNENQIHTIRHYLAFVDDQPVGTGSIICKHGVASVWNLCTIDAYRRQGIANTLLYTMLNEANKDGYDLAMLYATAQSYQLFNQFGFDIFTQRQWFLPPSIQYAD